MKTYKDAKTCLEDFELQNIPLIINFSNFELSEYPEIPIDKVVNIQVQFRLSLSDPIENMASYIGKSLIHVNKSIKPIIILPNRSYVDSVIVNGIVQGLFSKTPYIAFRREIRKQGFVIGYKFLVFDPAYAIKKGVFFLNSQ